MEDNSRRFIKIKNNSFEYIPVFGSSGIELMEGDLAINGWLESNRFGSMLRYDGTEWKVLNAKNMTQSNSFVNKLKGIMSVLLLLISLVTYSQTEEIGFDLDLLGNELHQVKLAPFSSIASLTKYSTDQNYNEDFEGVLATTLDTRSV